jgi:carbamoylphosphate synthase large subunit
MKVLVLGPAPGEPAVAAVQAILALRAAGCEVVLIDPSAASITTDRDLAQHTYLEPVTREVAEKVIAAEKPDAVLATTAGAEGVKLALALKRPGLQVLGASAEAPRYWGSAEGTIVDVVMLRDATSSQIVCTLEHPDARGVHPADSIAVSPARLSQAQLDQAQQLAHAALEKLGAFGGTVRFGVSASIEVLDAAPYFSHECGLATRISGLPVASIATAIALGTPLLKGEGREREALRGEVRDHFVRLPVFDPGNDSTLGRSRRSRGHVIGYGSDVDTAMRNAWEALQTEVPLTSPGERDALVRPLLSGEGITAAILGAGAECAEAAEIDWACVHAGRALTAAGFTPVLLSPNPDSVAFELKAVRTHLIVPLTADAVVSACRSAGATFAFVQSGGDTALALAPALEAAGIFLLGSPSTAIDAVNGEVLSTDTSDAVLVDLELVADRTGKIIVGGVLQQVEPALVHPGDAAFSLPPHSLKPETIERLKDAASAFVHTTGVVGLLSLRCAVRGKSVAIVSASPRVSRALPFVEKTTGVELVTLAVRVSLGDTLKSLGIESDPEPKHHAVKEAVLPVTTGAIRLGPSSRATGTVMSLADSLPAAFANSQLAAGTALPRSGRVLLTLTDEDNPSAVDLARRLDALGFEVHAPQGTHAYLMSKRVSVHLAVNPSAANLAMLIDTHSDDWLRRQAVMSGVPHFSTVEAARLLVSALEARAAGERAPRPLQAFFEERP